MFIQRRGFVITVTVVLHTLGSGSWTFIFKGFTTNRLDDVPVELKSHGARFEVMFSAIHCNMYRVILYRFLCLPCLSFLLPNATLLPNQVSGAIVYRIVEK